VGWGTHRGRGTTRRRHSTREAHSRLLGRDCNTPPSSKYRGGQRGAAPARRRRRAGPRRRRPRCTATRNPGFLAARGRVHSEEARGGGRRRTRLGNGCWRRSVRGWGKGEKNETFFPVINLISNYNCFI
jgi:hypothetical protein